MANTFEGERAQRALALLDGDLAMGGVAEELVLVSANFWLDLPNLTGFRPQHQPRPGRNTVRFGKSAQKYPWVPRNLWSGVSGTENLNMKLVLG